MMSEQPVVQFEANHDEPTIGRITTGRCAVFSRRCPGKDSPNEDAAAIIPAGPEASVLAVADGCGGMADGEQAARLAIETLREAVAQSVREQTILRAAVLDAIEEANQRVRQLGTGAATTISIVAIDHGTVRSCHVGDSMILQVGNHGKIKMQTKSHSPVGYAVAAGMIDEQEAVHHDDRHLVSNVIGTDDMHIEIGPCRRLASRDTVLVATDGLADNLHVDEIVEIVRKGELRSAAEKLVSVATQRMNNDDGHSPSKPDDLTFILYRLR
jgi:serine/threonine protein phosphatase PrpC